MRIRFDSVCSTALVAGAVLLSSPAAAQPSAAATTSPTSRLEVRRVQDSVHAILAKAITDSAFPGAVAVIGDRNGILFETSAGRLDWKPSPEPNGHTLWDLASLTKVVALTTAMMQLVEQRKVELDAPVQRYLPNWTGPLKERVTVRHLLTHSSGLPAWRALYKEASSPEEALSLAYATPLDTEPGVRMLYSDIGAILLGQIVVRVSSESFDHYVGTHVFRPLGMRETMFRPPASLRKRIAPTEVDPWRQRHIWGEVHDENAYALGGISSHAGLFSSAEDLARFARMYLNGGMLDSARIVSAETIRQFTTVQNPALSNRALGWEVPNGSNSAGHRMSSSAFGHTGFTGTSIWIDPQADVFVILLTNRVNPTRDRRGIFDVRQSVADAVMGALTITSGTR